MKRIKRFARWLGNAGERVMMWKERRLSILNPLVRLIAKYLSANDLTYIKGGLSVPLAWSLWAGNLSLAAFFAISAAFLDFLDGPVARYKKEASTKGRILDSITDKLIVGIPLVTMVIKIRTFGLIAGLIILTVLEIFLGIMLVQALRCPHLSRFLHPDVYSVWGKGKMVFEVSCVAVLLLEPKSAWSSVFLWLAVLFATINILSYLFPKSLLCMEVLKKLKKLDNSNHNA